MMFVGLGIIALCINLFVYPRVNAQRAKRLSELLEAGTSYSPDEIRAMGDKAPDFRYTL